MKSIIFSAFISAFLFGESVLASQFCYRDAQNELICANNMEELPAEFQKKAFFLDLPNPSGARQNAQQRSNNQQPNQPRLDIQPERNTAVERRENVNSQTINGLPAAKTLAPSGVPPKEETQNTRSAPVNSSQNHQNSSIKSQQASTQPAQVKIIVAEWCGYCRALEKFLRAEGVSYESLDIDQDPRAAALYQQHGSLPISQIGETLVVGFDPVRYRSLLDANLPY